MGWLVGQEIALNIGRHLWTTPNQKGFNTKITQNSSVYLGFDAEVPQKILQGLYYN